MHATIRCSTENEKLKRADSLWGKFGCKNKKPRSQEHVWYTDTVMECLPQRKGTVQKQKRKASLGEMPSAVTYCVFHPPVASLQAWLGYLTWIPTCPFPSAAQAQERDRTYPPVETILSAFWCLNALHLVQQALSISNFTQGRKQDS